MKPYEPTKLPVANLDCRSLLPFLCIANMELLYTNRFVCSLLYTKKSQCANVAVPVQCGGSRPMGKRTRRARRVPSCRFLLPMEVAA